MAIKSRKLLSRRVTVESIQDGTPLEAQIRALNDMALQWVDERNTERDMQFTAKSENPLGFLRDIVRMGLEDVFDVVDPDTGRPFQIRFYYEKMGDERLRLVSNDSLDALSEYIAPLANAIVEASQLKREERDAVRPTSTSTTAAGSADAPDAKETSTDAG